MTADKLHNMERIDQIVHDYFNKNKYFEIIVTLRNIQRKNSFEYFWMMEYFWNPINE